MPEVLAAVEAGQDSLVTGVAELISGIVQAGTRRLDVPGGHRPGTSGSAHAAGTR